MKINQSSSLVMSVLASDLVCDLLFVFCSCFLINNYFWYFIAKKLSFEAALIFTCRFFSVEN